MVIESHDGDHETDHITGEHRSPGVASRAITSLVGLVQSSSRSIEPVNEIACNESIDGPNRRNQLGGFNAAGHRARPISNATNTTGKHSARNHQLPVRRAMARASKSIQSAQRQTDYYERPYASPVAHSPGRTRNPFLVSDLLPSLWDAHPALDPISLPI